MLLRSSAALGSRLELGSFLPEVSVDINEPIPNHQVGQNGQGDKAKVGLPGDSPYHYQEKPYVTRGKGFESVIEDMAVFRANSGSGIADANGAGDS